MATEEAGSERTAVRTYVPADQRDIWDEHAEELDMSRSEFVRTMVQAGRRGFDPGGNGAETTSNGTGGYPDGTGEASAGTAEDDGDSFEDRVLELLEDGPLSWDELFEALTDDVERRLDDALDRLQAENEIKHSGRKGGYVRAE